MNLNFHLRNLDEQFSYKEKPDIISIDLDFWDCPKKSLILTDSTKLIQILSNLINNATKFTSEGRIDFGYSLKDGYLEFFVKDTGIGIPPEHHEKIFERFFQVDNLVSRKFGGTGLGLSICKAYVELMGGKIWVISQPGRRELIFVLQFLTALRRSEWKNSEDNLDDINSCPRFMTYKN